MNDLNNMEESENISFQISLKSDKNISKMLTASEMTQTPIKFFKKNIEKMYIDGEEINPDMIQIGPPISIIKFDFKIGDRIYSEIPFNYKKNSNDELIFEMNSSSDLRININIKIKFIEDKKINVSLSLSEKSDNIYDLLNLELIKQGWYGKPFEIYMIGIDECLLYGTMDFFSVNEDLISVYKKLNFINDSLNLSLKHEKDCTISGEDLKNIEQLCRYIKNKKIPIDNFSVICYDSVKTLEKILLNRLC